MQNDSYSTFPLSGIIMKGEIIQMSEGVQITKFLSLLGQKFIIIIKFIMSLYNINIGKG